MNNPTHIEAIEHDEGDGTRVLLSIKALADADIYDCGIKGCSIVAGKYSMEVQDSYESLRDRLCGIPVSEEKTAPNCNECGEKLDPTGDNFSPDWVCPNCLHLQ